MPGPSTIAISPGMQDVSLSKGQSYEGEFSVINPPENKGEINVTIAVSPMSFENDTYDLYFDYPMDYNQIVNWIEIEESELKIALGEKRPIKYKINVPEDAPDGSQYAAFLVKLKANSEEKPMGVSVINDSQIAMLLYSTVEGETREEGKIIENGISLIYLNSPIKTTSFLENLGNIHSPATFTLSVYTPFSDEPVYTNEETPETSIIIPGTTHYAEHTWSETPKLGIYKIVQEIDFADQTAYKTRYALVCPTWFLVLVALFIASCVVFLLESRRRRKIYKNVLKNP